ncbi:MAG TPA: hypothetical protein VGP72_09840 [Planctomycetota bacterium]|jgi:hypothetical protein
MPEALKKRAWFQIHLSTTVIQMIAAGPVIYFYHALTDRPSDGEWNKEKPPHP